MNSRYFKNLKKEIHVLIKGLLPTDKQLSDPEYSDELWQMQIKSFIVLSHATLENYFEELAYFKCQEACQKYLKDHKISNVLLSLILTYKVEWFLEKPKNYNLSLYQKIKNLFYNKKNESRKSPKNFNNAIHTSIEKSIEELHKLYESEVINKNMGCSLNNLSQLFTPLVLDLSTIKLDDDLFKNIDAFTKKRGQYAHKCSYFWALKPIGFRPAVTIESAKYWKDKMALLLEDPHNFALKDFDKIIYHLA